MAIQGKVKVPLTVGSILNLISEYDIYRRFFGEFRINELTINHLRKDNSPSFIIKPRDGKLHHFDFGDDYWKGNAFCLVKQIYNCNFDDALRIIDKEFGLGIVSRNETKDYKKSISEYKKPEIVEKKTLIQVSTRKFTKEELVYWNSYHQDVQDLKNNNIYSIKSLYINRKLFQSKPSDIRFGYFYPEKGKWKIYSPFADKKGKWISNVPISTCVGLNNLKLDRTSFVCKSLKDYMVCRKIVENVCYVQNESLPAFSQETIDILNKNSLSIYYCGDSDPPGKSFSQKVSRQLKFKTLEPDNSLLPQVKDFADWGRTMGLNELNQFFNKFI